MVGAALKRDRRREEDDRPEADQRIDERRCVLGGEMLGDFQAQDQIESPLQANGRRQVMSQESLAGDFQKGGVHVAAIDPKGVGDALLGEDRQPRANAAADVDNRAGLDRLRDERDDLRRRLARAAPPVFEKLARVWLRHRRCVAARERGHERRMRSYATPRRWSRRLARACRTPAMAMKPSRG